DGLVGRVRESSLAQEVAFEGLDRGLYFSMCVRKSIPRILDIMFPLLLEIVTVVSRGRLSEEPLRVFAAAPSTYPFDIAYYKI
ncbi:hypothetical protein, partial [Ellagibacter isourolithinifaciens]|uniref:hypothetical protein n=1 Tax=Ellagibacter isourolithinifaciens TaxID=2137581 RepID=UPI003AACD950